MRPIAALSRLLRARIRPESPSMNFSLSSMLRTFALWLLFACGTHAQAANDAAFVSQSVPTSMVAGRIHNVSITMRNTGTTAWSAAGKHLLGAQNPGDSSIWRYQRVAVPASIAAAAWRCPRCCGALCGRRR